MLSIWEKKPCNLSIINTFISPFLLAAKGEGRISIWKGKVWIQLVKETKVNTTKIENHLHIIKIRVV